jgi:hypothetical protein
MSFKRSSDIYFIKAGEGAFGKSIPFFFANITISRMVDNILDSI